MQKSSSVPVDFINSPQAQAIAVTTYLKSVATVIKNNVSPDKLAVFLKDLESDENTLNRARSEIKDFDDKVYDIFTKTLVKEDNA